jgi:hypothetical protein
MRNKFIIIFIFFSANSYCAQGQQLNRYSLEGQYGTILAHAADLIPVSQSNPYGYQLSYQWLKMDKENWMACQCFHYLGLHLSHHNFDNPEVLGTATAISASFEPLLWKNEKWQISLSAGMGLTYLSRVYDEHSNPDNNFFSAPVSFLLYLTPKVSYVLTEKLQASLAFHYNHISNGGQNQPNRGMNFPTLGLGISYLPRSHEFPDHSPATVERKWNGYLEVFGTFRDAPEKDRRQPALGLALGTYYQIGKINAFGVGMETTLDRSLAFGEENTEGWMHTPFASHHFLFGRFDFSQRLGYYLHKPENYQSEKLFFQRYVLSYQIWQKLRVGIELKAHGHVAENIGFRLGYGF